MILSQNIVQNPSEVAHGVLPEIRIGVLPADSLEVTSEMPQVPPKVSLRDLVGVPPNIALGVVAEVLPELLPAVSPGIPLSACSEIPP